MIARVGGGVALGLAEAAWGTLFIDAVANGTASAARPAVDLPFVGIALATSLAVVLAAVVRRWLWSLLVALFAAAATAELMAGLTQGVAIGAAPAGQLAVRATTWAAIVAVLAWGRGTWLGRVPPSETQAAVSVVFGWVVTIAVLIHRAESPSSAFARATSGAGWLLLVLFLAGFAAVGWAHVRSLDRFFTGRPRTGPGGAWLTATGVPFAAVAAVGFLFGGVATAVVPALSGIARGLGRNLSSMGTWLFSHLFDFSFHFHPRSIPTFGGGAGRALAGRSPGHSNALLNVLVALPEVIAGLAVLLLVGYVASIVVRRLLRRRAAERPDEVRTSIFSWAHLLGHIRAAVARLRLLLVRRLRRRRRGGDAGAVATVPAEAGAPEGVGVLGPVRAAYRRFLITAETAHVGREPTETPRELSRRLHLDRQALGTLTGAYERSRYGEEPTEPDAALDAAATLTRELSRPRPGGAWPGPS